MPVTLRQLFTRIAGTASAISTSRVESFLTDAGVGSGLFGGTKVSMAASKFMDKFDASSGTLSWDAFCKKGMSLLPPGLAAKADAATVTAEVDKLFSQLDPRDRGVTVDELSKHIEDELTRRGKSFAGTQAEIGAKVLLHALDENGDKRLQRSEVRGFALDVVAQVASGGRT
ncbi:MAG: hypothetical protein HYS27_01640 [Deltaproteobacteria bacterium]|nr:hypothetical protein [Deltaproteobacteria bacterium]